MRRGPQLVSWNLKVQANTACLPSEGFEGDGLRPSSMRFPMERAAFISKLLQLCHAEHSMKSLTINYDYVVVPQIGGFGQAVILISLVSL